MGRRKTIESDSSRELNVMRNLNGIRKYTEDFICKITREVCDDFNKYSYMTKFTKNTFWFLS